MDKALCRDDIYLNTTPEELSHFTNFLANNPKFDVVVDGMNSLYIMRMRKAGGATGGKMNVTAVCFQE